MGPHLFHSVVRLDGIYYSGKTFSEGVCCYQDFFDFTTKMGVFAQGGAMPHFDRDNINIVGMYYQDVGLEILQTLGVNAGCQLQLKRELFNPADSNAIAVFTPKHPHQKIGYIGRGIAARLAPILDRGSQYSIILTRISSLKGKLELVATITTYPVSTNSPVSHHGRIEASTKVRSANSTTTPTGKPFRKITDFKAHFEKFNDVTGIYVIWNNVNKKCYVGQAVDVKRRMLDHYRRLWLRDHPNQLLQKEWTDLGERCFRLDLLQSARADELDFLEKAYIDRLGSFFSGYNATSDGLSNKQKISIHSPLQERQSTGNAIQIDSDRCSRQPNSLVNPPLVNFTFSPEVKIGPTFDTIRSPQPTEYAVIVSDEEQDAQLPLNNKGKPLHYQSEWVYPSSLFFVVALVVAPCLLIAVIIGVLAP